MMSTPSVLLDNDDDDHDVEEDEEDPGWRVRDGGKAAAEEWGHVKESQKHKSEEVSTPRVWGVQVQRISCHWLTTVSSTSRMKEDTTLLKLFLQ